VETLVPVDITLTQPQEDVIYVLISVRLVKLLLLIVYHAEVIEL